MGTVRSLRRGFLSIPYHAAATDYQGGAMGMRRGAVKTPGGKLVAVTVQTDQSGLPVACRLDGDFFIDGDGAPTAADDP